MVDKIQSGIRYENGSFTITIPEDAIPGTFNVTVSGMFQDISDGANWVPGETYAAPLDPAADSIEAAIHVLQTDGSTLTQAAYNWKAGKTETPRPTPPILPARTYPFPSRCSPPT